MSATEIEAWVMLTRTPGLNVQNLSSALATAGSASALISSSRAALRSLGLPLHACEYIPRSGGTTAPEARWLDHEAHHLLHFSQPQFPALLRHLADCPIALYVDGQAETLSQLQLAIVGSRNPSAAGRDNAFEFARSLSLAGFTVTSGLAEGIDAAAHRGALAAGGVTIAVLGTGIEEAYPAIHAGLAREVARSGALISEFPLDTPARRANFPQRNRLIAGLSVGTLVVEAARRSGSLITARLAGEAGREVFAMPGSIHNPLARGCHQLIRQGAKLTECIDDIVVELSSGTEASAHRRSPPAPASSGRALDKQQEILLDALGFEPADLDALIGRTGQSAQAVSAQLLVLELEGYVTSAHGGRFVRRQEPRIER